MRTEERQGELNISERRRSGQDVRFVAPWAPSAGRALREARFLAGVLDLVVVFACMVAATVAQAKLGGWSNTDFRELILLSIASLPFWLILFRAQHLYLTRIDTRFFADVRRVTNSVILGVIVVILLGWPVGYAVPRDWVVALGAVLLPALLLERQVIRMFVRGRRRRGMGLHPIVIMGTNAEAMDLADSLADPLLGKQVMAFIATAQEERSDIGSVPVLEGSDPAREAAAFGVDTVVLAATALDGTVPSGLLRSFLDRGIKVEMTSGLTDVALDRITVHTLGRHPMIALQPGYRGGWRAAAKRAFDVVVSGLLLVLLSPVFAVAAIAVKFDSDGPVIFSQTRAGLRGQPFQLHKIRSMVKDAEDHLGELQARSNGNSPLFKMDDDPRVTRVGKWIRRLSIDELPQLWNVLRGEMSLVGPRPALPSEVPKWDDELRNRLRVRPGITGMWQVNGRSSTSFEEYQRLDLFYIDNWSMLTDMGILMRTVPAVLSREGAK